MAKTTRKYADGGPVQAGLQPTMAIGYADGGSLDGNGKGPWSGDLNSKTSNFNTGDTLRGEGQGDQNHAGLITPPPPVAPAPVAPKSSSPGLTPRTAPILNQDGTPETLDQQGSRIKTDASAFIDSPWTKLGASMLIPGFAKAMPTLALAQGAYNLYQGATGGDQQATPGTRTTMGGIGSLMGPNNGVMSIGDYLGAKLRPGTPQDPSKVPVENKGYDPTGADPDNQMGVQSGNGITAATDLKPQIDAEAAAQQKAQADAAAAAAPAAGLAPTAASDSFVDSVNNFSHGSSGNSWRAAQGEGGAGGNAGTGYNGSSINSLPSQPGESTSSMAADGGMAVPGGFNRAGQAGAMADTPPGPPGLQMPGQPAAASADPMHPALAGLHVQNTLANPQIMQAIKAHIDQAIQAGQINPQQLQMMGQLAQSAIQHPELWPKLRQFAIQAGFPDAQQLPQQFNQGLAMAMMAAAQASQHGDRPGAFKDGGMLRGAGTGTSDSIPAHNQSTGQPVKLSNGEYIIPADVVATKGKEFFDNIVRKYHTPAAMQR